MTWKVFVRYHLIALSQMRDEVCSRCLPDLAQLAKAPSKVKQNFSQCISLPCRDLSAECRKAASKSLSRAAADSTQSGP